MSCTEITNALDWAKQSKINDFFPVTAFVTRHQGILTKFNDPLDKGMDICTYAVGSVAFVATLDQIGAGGHLAGILSQFANSSAETGMPAAATRLSVEIYSDGTVIFQDILNGNPVPHPITVKATCVGGVLLTGTYANGVIVVGVRREPEQIPPP